MDAGFAATAARSPRGPWRASPARRFSARVSVRKLDAMNAPPLVKLLALLALPVAELWLLIELGGVFGALTVVLWVIAMVGVGLTLLRRQAFAVGGLIASLRGERMPTRQELGPHALWAGAGVLFAIPGVLTDVAALGLIVAGFVRRLRGSRTGRPVEPRPTRATRAGTVEVEVLPPGRVPSPFVRRPRVIDVD